MKLFLSYSRRDDKLAKAVATQLEAAGHDVWRDDKSIPGGAAWRASIEHGIRSTDAFLVLLSPSVVDSPRYLREELDFARSADRPIVPVHLKPVETLPEGFGLTLSGVERIDLYPSFDRGMKKLLSELGPGSELVPPPKLEFRGWAKGRLAGVTANARRLRLEAKQRDLGRKALKVAGAVAAVGMTAAAAASKARASEESKTAERDRDARASSRVAYRKRAEELLSGFTREWSRSNEEITVTTYQEEFRPRFWHLLGQLEGLEPPTVDLRSAHRDFVRTLKDSLTNLDEAFHQLQRGNAEGASRAYQRSYEQLFNTFNSFVALLASGDVD